MGPPNARIPLRTGLGDFILRATKKGRTVGNSAFHTSMPTARIKARPLVWRNTPGFIR
jgi:hypothetical protein